MAITVAISLKFFLLIHSALAVCAQHFLPAPKGVKNISSTNYAGASISYKETSICETTPGVKSYSGYVTLPSGSDKESYDTSLFFWFFEARNAPSNAPLSIYVGGGPGSSALDNTNGFPCTINPDSNSTTLNPWSWNANVNMLYVDMPSPAGFSYVSLLDGVVDLLSPAHDFTPVGSDGAFPGTNLTTVKATLSGQSPEQTVTTAKQAAAVMWDFAQVWFQEFPEYNTTEDRVSLWTNSYGGIWGPAIMSHFERQNEAIRDGTLDDDAAAKPIKLDTLGMTNACIDMLVQAESWPQFAYKNTYDIEAIPKEVFDDSMTNLTMAGGCEDQARACRAAAEVGDPLGLGTNQTVNEMCVGATLFCFQFVQGAYQALSGRNAFDVTEMSPISSVPSYSAAFFNRPHVQEALGVPVNFSQTADGIRRIFFEVTGDPARADKSDLEYLLERGVGVAMVYGDRDYRCNWIGAEKLSLALEYPASEGFGKAGYAPITTNGDYDGGLVRQYGNVSFSRVFEAGHSVTAYQPETVFRIFERSMFGKDVATGKVPTTCGDGIDCAKGEPYATKGKMTIMDVKSKGSPSPEPICLVLDAVFSCTPNQLQALADGSAVVENFVVVSPEAAIVEEGPGGGSGGDDSQKDGGTATVRLPGFLLFFTMVVVVLVG